MRLVRPPADARVDFRGLELAIARCQISLYSSYIAQGRADDWRADPDPNPFPYLVL